jgi:molybdate transport system substrate-binding protein
MRELVTFLAAIWLMLSPATAVAQSTVTVFHGGAMTQPVEEAADAFTRSTGNRVTNVGDTTGSLMKRIASGEKPDIIFVAGPAMDTLEKEKRIATGTRVDLARALIGVGVRVGAPSPNLSTPETFKAALLAARSVSYVSPAAGGTSGTYIEGLLEKMGIADAMKSKIVYQNQGSEVAAAVASGKAELGITFSSELKPNPGVRVAGVLPAAIQMPTIYSAALTPGASEAARAFMRVLSGPDGRAAIERAGMEPLSAAR